MRADLRNAQLASIYYNSKVKANKRLVLAEFVLYGDIAEDGRKARMKQRLVKTIEGVREGKLPRGAKRGTGG